MEQSDRDTDLAAEGDPAAEAFARLEGQVALMRRAVEQLAAERADIVIPDYGATLSEMTVRLAEVSQALASIAGKPAMRLTPEALVERMEAAAQAARRTDHNQLTEARRQFIQGIDEMRGLAGRVRATTEQHRQLFQAAGVGIIVGILVWSILPGTVARSAPKSWHWPDRMATRMLGAPSPWEAGSRLMQTGNPETWRTLVDVADLVRDNERAIADCRRTAEQAAKPARCTIEIGP